jgi:hypothetical protein
MADTTTEYNAPLLTKEQRELEDPAWAQYDYDKVAPDTFDIDKYNQLAYKQAIRSADDSIYGKLAGIGDNVLSAKGMGIHSGSWTSRVNELNAAGRDAHEKAAYQALAQTIVAQQQKFNQLLAAGKMNLDVFAHSTDANMRRIGIHIDSAKLASALDQVKMGNYTAFNKIVKTWADGMTGIKEAQAERENKMALEKTAGQTSTGIAQTQGATARDTAKIQAAAGETEAGIRAASAERNAALAAETTMREAQLNAENKEKIAYIQKEVSKDEAVIRAKAAVQVAETSANAAIAAEKLRGTTSNTNSARAARTALAEARMKLASAETIAKNNVENSFRETRAKIASSEKQTNVIERNKMSMAQKRFEHENRDLILKLNNLKEEFNARNKNAVELAQLAARTQERSDQIRAESARQVAEIAARAHLSAQSELNARKAKSRVWYELGSTLLENHGEQILNAGVSGLKKLGQWTGILKK